MTARAKNALSGLGWITLMVVLGYYMGQLTVHLLGQ